MMTTGWRYYGAMWMDRMNPGAIAVAPSPEANVYCVGRVVMQGRPTGNYRDVSGFIFEEVEFDSSGMVPVSPFGDSRSASREAIL